MIAAGCAARDAHPAAVMSGGCIVWRAGGGVQVLAVKVLLDHVQDLDRAHEYASKVCSVPLPLPPSPPPSPSPPSWPPRMTCFSHVLPELNMALILPTIERVITQILLHTSRYPSL